MKHLISILLENSRQFIILIFFATFLLIGLNVYRDYGVPWDELDQRIIGISNYNYILDKNNTIQPDIGDHGPVIELALVLIEQLFKLEDYRDIIFMRHLITFLLFFTGVVFFFLLSSYHFKNHIWALLGSLCLILSPRIFAESFYNSKDLPFLAVFIISLYSLIKLLDRKTLFNALLHAIICAILVDIRIMGLIIFFITYLFLRIEMFKLKHSEKSKKIAANVMTFYVMFFFFFSICFWPYLWENPLINFVLSFKSMGKFNWDNTVLYLGSFLNAQELPWHYIPVWLVITTPFFYTVNFLIGTLVILKALNEAPCGKTAGYLKQQGVFYRIHPRGKTTGSPMLKTPLALIQDSKNRNEAIFLLSFFIPIIVVIILNPTLYDGWRHMFFIYPPFLLISLRGIISISELIKLKFIGNTATIGQNIYFFLFFLSLLSTAHWMVRNHPHENVYFNKLTRQTWPDLRYTFELDYWGLSYRQALEYILANDIDKRININTTNLPGYHNKYILSPGERNRLNYVNNLEEAKYFLSNYRHHRENYSYQNEFFSIIIDETRIMAVYKLK